MSLRHALLAMLTSSRPMTAYDLSRNFGMSVGHVWHAPDSQIYPELNRMAAEGLVTTTEVPRGGKGRKKEYRITDSGVTAFRAWMDQPLEIRRQRDTAYLKAAYLEWADPEAARAQLQQHLAHWTDQQTLLEGVRQSLLDRTHPTLSYRLDTFPPEQHDRIVTFKVLAYDGLIDQARCEVVWARRGLELLADLPD